MTLKLFIDVIFSKNSNFSKNITNPKLFVVAIKEYLTD